MARRLLFLGGAAFLLCGCAALSGCGSTAQITSTGSHPTRPKLRGAQAQRLEAGQRDCFLHLLACGLPDAGGNDGAHGALTPRTGLVVLKTPGEVYQNVDLRGNIVVRADHVTIRNVRVTGTGEGITIYSGDSSRPIVGTTIEDSTIRGFSGTASGALADGILNAGGNRGTSANRLFVYNTAQTGWNGPGAISNSYLIVDTYAAGNHDEAVFEPGGDAGSQLHHDTLLNTQDQTAAVFFSTEHGRGTGDSITDSLLAGGGWTIYAADGPTDPRPAAGPTITGNRFARCITASVYAADSGVTTCTRGHDAYGYFPKSGTFGIATAIGRETTWRANEWDDNGRPAVS